MDHWLNVDLLDCYTKSCMQKSNAICEDHFLLLYFYFLKLSLVGGGNM